MSYRGTVRNGVVILDHPAMLPDGTVVDVEPIVPQGTSAGTGATGRAATPLGARLLKYAGVVDDLPVDMAEQHDHYLHGQPKR